MAGNDTTGLLAHCSFFGTSNEADLQLFSQFFPVSLEGRIAPDTELDQIFRIKFNDHQHPTASLQVCRLDNVALKRLGVLLRSNTSLERISLAGNQRQVLAHLWLCVGLQPNTHIKDLSFDFIPIGGTPTKLAILAPFLHGNPSLAKLAIRNCFLESADINFLSDQLMRRSKTDSLTELDFSGNCIGNGNLDKLTLALKRNTSVTRLNLAANAIGGAGVASLATLLEGSDDNDGDYSHNSNLEELILSTNAIQYEHALTLIRALGNNKKLKTLNLKNNGWITRESWAKLLNSVLRLVCDGSSIARVMESNHTLSSLAGPYESYALGGLREDLPSPTPDDLGSPVGSSRPLFFNQSLGANKAFRLRSAFALNHIYGIRRDLFNARCKILMIHIQEEVNLGDTSIPVGLMPGIMSSIWMIWEDTIPSNIILGAFHRILLANPDLCSESNVVSTEETAMQVE